MLIHVAINPCINMIKMMTWFYSLSREPFKNLNTTTISTMISAAASMKSVLAASQRRMMSSSSSSAAAAGIDWSGILAKATSSQSKSEIVRLNQLFMELESNARAVPTTVQPIDFQAYAKSIKANNVVSEYEKSYSSLKLPQLADETAAEADAKLNELSKQATEMVASTSKRLAELEGLLSDLYKKRTTKDTTVDDVKALYPEIKKEIDQEIKNHEWIKGI